MVVFMMAGITLTIGNQIIYTHITGPLITILMAEEEAHTIM